MKLTVTVELDKDSSQKIQTVLSKPLQDLFGLFENADLSVEETATVAPEPKPAAKPAAKLVTKPAKRVPKKKSRPRKSNKDKILLVIKKHKDGINFKELQQETGLTGKLISDNVYLLKKQNKIEKTEAGMFVAL